MAIHLYALPQKTPLSFRSSDILPGHSKLITTRQVIQITNSALYKHLALLSATVYSCVSTSPHHIFFHQMYGNTVRTISTLDQFTHILPQAVNCITTPRYYFQGITFISYWIVNTTIEEADYSQAYLPQMWGSQTYPPRGIKWSRMAISHSLLWEFILAHQLADLLFHYIKWQINWLENLHI